MTKQIKPTGTDQELVEKFTKATLEIDARATEIKKEADQMKAYAQEKRKAGFGEQAMQFEDTENKLLCKWNGFEEALRIIKQTVEQP